VTISASCPFRAMASPGSVLGKARSPWHGDRIVVMRHPLDWPSPLTLLRGTVRAFSRRVGLLCPLLTSTPRSGHLAMTSVPRDTAQISWGKSSNLRRTPAGFTVTALDGYGLRGWVPARPTVPASDPVSVRQAAPLIHASFRPFLAVRPLRFSSTSPPSGCARDFHPQAAGHAQHTPGPCGAPPAAALGLTGVSGPGPPCSPWWRRTGLRRHPFRCSAIGADPRTSSHSSGSPNAPGPNNVPLSDS
jgi:hypothetical protein